MSGDLGPLLLSGPRYVLGEHEADYTSIANLAERAAEFGLTMTPQLWGWGGVWRSDRSLEELAIESGRATLESAGADPSSIDLLLLCSTRVPGPSEGHGAFVKNIVAGIGLGDIAFYGMTLNRCTSLLAAIDVAAALVSTGRYQRALVVTTDKVGNEAHRMVGYAIFSDGAASCLVSSDGEVTDSYELLGCASAQDTASLEWSKEISSDLGRAVSRELLGPHGMKVGDVAGLMHLNIFKPLVVMKERQAGFTPAQLYTENVSRVGHCFSADPLINLVDQAAADRIVGGRCYMLAATVPGSRFGALLRRRPESSSDNAATALPAP